MKRLHGKSVLLGMGIGIILTALLGMLFFLGYQPVPDDESVMKRAEVLGMVQASEIIVDGIHRQVDGGWRVETKDGETMQDFALRLKNAGVIKSELELEIAANKAGMVEPLKNKTIFVPANSPVSDVLKQLRSD